MKLLRNCSLLFSLSLPLSLGSCGFDERNTTRSLPSQGKSVSVHQTPLDNQGKVGFCWAYASMGLIESFHKMETGSEVNLSEEALGFYRIAEGIKSMLNTMNLMDFMKAMSKVWLPEGWFSRHTQNSVMKSELDGLALIKKYGVVRESDWSFKMKTQAERDKVFLTIRNKADILHAARNCDSLKV